MAENDVTEESESTEQEAKPIAETLQIQKVGRCEVKEVHDLESFYLPEDEKLFFTCYANGKDVIVCKDEISDVDINNCASCFGKYIPDRNEELIQFPVLS